MQKKSLLIFPLVAGSVLMGISWYLSYPISVSSANDFIFNHVCILYWFSLPLLLSSMFLMAVTTKSDFLKWLLSIGFVLTLFSLTYFYAMVPTSDSQSFRGLTEYFTKSQNLDPSQLNHNYYQWPAFFILADIVISVSGLSLASYEFLLYAIIGLLLATSLYTYAVKKHEVDGFLTVAIFFISLTYFIDYQAAPFSLALGLLFLLFMIEICKKNIGIIIVMVVIYVSLLFTHLFVPIFFVLYLFIRTVLDKNRKSRTLYGYLFLFSSFSYVLVQLTFAKFSLAQLISTMTQAPAGYSYEISQITSTELASVPINNIAQIFSRTVTIGAILLCIAGAIFLVTKRKTKIIDIAIFTTGTLYTVLGLVLNTLGERAIALLFVPLALGAAYAFKIKHGKYLLGIFLIFVTLFLFIPVHQLFNTEIQFQTQQTYNADNFFINHYNWNSSGLIVSDYRTNTYLLSKLPQDEYIEPWLQTGAKANAILYTPQFIGLRLGNCTTMENLAQEQKLDVLYNDGSSTVLINSNR